MVNRLEVCLLVNLDYPRNDPGFDSRSSRNRAPLGETVTLAFPFRSFLSILRRLDVSDQPSRLGTASFGCGYCAPPAHRPVYSVDRQRSAPRPLRFLETARS